MSENFSNSDVSLTLNPSFVSSISVYNCSVDNSVTKVNVNATLSDGKAKLEGTGSKDLNVGTNTIELYVTAEDGSKKIIIGNYDSVLLLSIINSCIKSACDEESDEDDDYEEKDSSATYVTNYVLDDKSDVHVMHISQEKNFTELSLSKRRLSQPFNSCKGIPSPGNHCDDC